MDGFFRLSENKSSLATEVIAGVTTFLTVSYTLIVTPGILSDAGMPFAGVFAASAICSALATLFMAFFANCPFAVAPGMGLNGFFAYTLCVGMNFHWREALVVVFAASAFHALIMTTRARKVLIASFPESLRNATSAGIGVFISFIGLKNAGLIAFTVSPGSYTITDAGMVLADSTTQSSLVARFTASHIVALVGLGVTLYLIGLERRTGDRYAPFLLGIIAATFVGIPLDITNIDKLNLLDFSAVYELKTVSFALFGDPGLASLLASPDRLLKVLAMCLVLGMTDVVDSFATIAGTGRLLENPVFTDADAAPAPAGKPAGKMERCLIANSVSGMLSALLGTSTSTAYIESATGIACGGRTGLTALVVGVLFLLCLPFSGMFSLIPGEALAPALVLAGLYLLSLVSRIDWLFYEESFPAALTILFTAITYNVLNGITAGFVSFVILKVAGGKARSLQPAMVAVAAALFVVFLMQNLIDWL